MRGICKKPKNLKPTTSQAAKRKILWGKERMRRAGEFIATVGSPSGRSIYVVWTRAAMGTCGQVTRVRTVLLTVRPVVAACVRTIGLHTRPDSK
jgi:hypothetical protein